MKQETFIDKFDNTWKIQDKMRDVLAINGNVIVSAYNRCALFALLDERNRKDSK